MLRYIGEILLNIDDQHMDKAEDWIKRAIEADKRTGMMWEVGRAHQGVDGQEQGIDKYVPTC